MAKKVNIQEAPILIQKPDLRFDKTDFEAAIWRHGYDVYHDKMVRCPCSTEVGQPLVTCKNCIGSGWVMVERTQTRMVLQSINLDTKIKDWSEEKAGTVKITCLDRDKVSFMDRIIILKGITTSNELLKIKSITSGVTVTKFAYTIYEIVSIINIFLYDGDGNILKSLVESIDYAVERNKIILGSGFDLNDDIRISIKYKYRAQFHVIDIARDVINADSKYIELGSSKSQDNFPLYAIGRRSHFVLDAQNYDDTLVLNNSGTDTEINNFKARLDFSFLLSNAAFSIHLNDIEKLGINLNLSNYQFEMVILNTDGSVLSDKMGTISGNNVVFAHGILGWTVNNYAYTINVTYAHSSMVTWFKGYVITHN